MRIRTKILIIALALILVTGAASVIVSQIVTRNIVKKQIASKLETVAESRRDRIQTFLETGREAVRQLSASIVIERFLLASEDDQERLRKFDDVMRRLKNTAGVGEHPYDLFVLDESGIIVASSNQRDIGTDRSSDPYFLNGREALFIKDAYVSQEGERNSLAFSAPILDEDNTALLGVVVARFPMEELNKITTDRTGLGETGEVYLVNQDGYMITPSRFVEDSFLKLKVDTENLRAALEDLKSSGAQEHQHEVILGKNYLDTDVLGIHEQIPEMNWCLLAEVSEKEAFAPIVGLTHSMLFILGVLLVVGLVISIRISGTITKPISKLHHGTEEVAGGNLDYKVGTGVKDEIGQLSRTFDDMTANLKESRAKLQKYQKTLEEKIEVGTRQLALAKEGLGREVEERQQVEQRLKIFSHSVESSVDGVVIGDLEGNITHVNEAAARMFGYSQEELRGTEIAFLYAENQLHKLEGALQATRQGGWTGELIGRRKGGGFFPVEVSLSIVVDDEGRIIASVATHRDITERKVVEEVLRESEERYRTLLENLPQKISYKDKRSVYVSCNQNYAHDLKIKPEEIAGKTDYDFYPKELADKYRADDRRLMESGETEEIEERYIQHGKELFVHTVKTPVRDEGGNVVGILGVFWDITERREAEQALRESEQRFRTIFDQATDGILLADPENKRFYTGNRMICEMLGYGLEELRNLGLMDIHPEQDLPHVLEQFEKQTRGEIKLARDIPVKRKDGTVFYADINSARVMLEGKTYLMGLFRDVTEGKQAEKALQESEEKYRDLFENASDLIQSVNPQGRFLYVNRAWRKTLGYDEEEVAGLNLFDIIHPHSQAHCVEVFQRVLSGETVDRIEAIFVAKDGRQIVVEGGANCKFLAGAPISTRGIFRDVTERKRVEKEREKLIHNVTERVKELNCLYGISDLVQAPDLSLEQILQGTVDLIPPSWQYPKITCARVVLEGQEFRTENFRETLWKQTKDIIAGGKRVGSLEVCHLEERPESDEGPFLKEERDLINAIAEQLGRIVERKRIERALRESEAKYRDLFEDASDLIQSVAPDGRFIYVNRAWRQTLGYDEQEIAGLNIFDIIHPDSQAHCMEVFQRVISGEVVDKIETVFVTKGGKKIVVEGTADCVFREGKPHSTRSIFRNVTERKKAEAALRESEERYRTLVETAQEGINIVSPQEEIIFSNKAFASMLGYEPWELEGKNLQELVTEEQYKTFQVESQKRVKGIVSRYEIEMRHRDGSYRSALLSAAPLYDSQGNHQGSLGMLVDITERKGAEEALRESEQRFRSIFDTATDGILLASLENKKFHTGNRRICEMLGYSLEEIQRLGVMDVHPEEDLPYVVEQFQRQARGEITLGRDIPVKRKDGSIFYAEVSASPITLEGKTYLMGLFRDVTERRQAEKALRQAEAERRRMTEALREAEKLALVGEMAGRVAHEVLNPVTALLSRTQSELDYANSSQATVAAVKGIIADWQENTKNGTLSHYLLQKSPGKSDTTYGEEDLAILFQAIEKNADNLKRNQEFLSFFERHIMRVVKIIDNLRQMARARREIEEVDVNSCLKEVAELFQDGLDKRKITLLRRLVPGLPKVYVDRTELFQVFSNLLRNAMRAIDNRGEGKGEVTFTSEVTGEEIWVRVIDNGVAIPVAERHLAFEPDFSAKVGEEGRELELPLSRRLVREMGGELLLESSPSESGSTFLVKLPLTKGAEVAETDTEKAVQV